MLESRVARGLMLLGAGIGVLSVAAVALEMRMNLPDWIVQVAMIKLAFVAAGGLLAAGALVGRHAKSRSLNFPASNLLPDEHPATFGEQAPDEIERVAVRGQDPGVRRSTDEREH